MENLYNLPLATRQANREAVREAMADMPAVYGGYLRALVAAMNESERKRVFSTRQANRVARGGQLVAEKIYQCPGAWAAQAWKSLTAGQRYIIDREVGAVLGEFGL